MVFNLKNKNIAAVSLIEIMMIFFIIGVVSVAIFGLSKPKAEYMKKIAVYSAYEQLQKAAMDIVAEGHIDFTTDAGTCPISRTGTTCSISDYNKYPGMNSQLPKVVSRSAKNSSGNPADPNISITSYSTSNASTFLHLQDGLCQRLASAYNLAAHNINCATTLDDNTHGSLINDKDLGSDYGTGEDNSDYEQPTDFSSYTPSLYLPNGQVYYFGKMLHSFNDAYEAYTFTYSPKNPVNNYEAEGDYAGDDGYFESWTQRYGQWSAFDFTTNETRLQRLNKYLKAYDTGTLTDEIKAAYYYKDFWTHSKDYFNVYVDINGKMANADDKMSAPDKLNEDVFLFRVYRDGAVRPDYESGFPQELLMAKVLYKAPGTTKYSSPSSWGGKYASIPLVYAQCYANTAGVYSTYTISAFGSYVDYSNLCPTSSYQPISDCIGKNGGTNCKVFINKPSFFVK